MAKDAIARYKVFRSDDGREYQFFCDLSGVLVCSTGIYTGEFDDSEVYTAWDNEGKKHFNVCKKCGRLVADVMYNPDVLNCVKCSPVENEPNYCPKCGRKVGHDETFCIKCGTRLMYGGDFHEK